MTRCSLILVAAGVFHVSSLHAQEASEGAAAPQDVFIVEPTEPITRQPNAQQPNGQQPNGQQPNGQAVPAAPAAPAAPAPVYAQPYQPPQAQQPVYGQQPGYAPQYQGRRLRAPYIEGAPLPPGGVIIERRRTGLIVSGACMFGVPYIITALSASIADEGALAIPLVGPLFYLDATDRPGDILLVLDSLVQTGGLALFILGLALKTKYVEYYGEGDSDQRRWSLLPQIGTTSGLQLDMRF